MKTNKDITYSGKVVHLDNSDYINCKFDDCILIYSGSVVSFDGCTFTKCNWSFQGSSANTLSLLRLLYQGLGEDGKNLVNSIFTDIKGENKKEAI